jgi:hypothetical protein
VVHKAEKGYVVKIKENEDVKSNSQFSKNENESGRISESGSSTRTSGTSGRSFYEETGPRKKITLTEIRTRQKQINEIDGGIEPGLSMASSGENFSRGLDRSMVTTGVKYSRDPKKKTVKEGYGPWGKMTQDKLDKIAKSKKREEKEKGILRKSGSAIPKHTTNYVTKVNKLSETSVIKELTGDETGASIGDQKEGELKRVDINLKTFKAKKFI